MKEKLRWRLYDWNDRAADRWQEFWLCEIRKIHRVKMQSYGLCIRCGRRVR